MMTEGGKRTVELGLTIPLQRQTGHRAGPSGGSGPMYCWDLHGIELAGRRCLLGVQTSSRYSFVLYDLSPFQWQQLADTAVQAVGQCLHLEGFSAPQVDRYLALAGSAAYTKTHGRREVAFLNRAWFFCLEQELAVDTGRQLQTGLMELCNIQPCRCAGHPGLGVARTRFWQDLAALGLRR